MPNTPKRDNLQRKLEDMERRIKTLETASRLRSASIGEGGLTLRDGGSIRVEPDGEVLVVDDEGEPVAALGYLGNTNAKGLVAYDGDGNRVFFSGDSASTGDLSEFTVWDGNGQAHFRLDPQGSGIAAPRVAYPLYKWRNVAGSEDHPYTFATNYGSGTGSLLYSGRITLHWPRVEWSIVNRMEATVGQMALRCEIEYPIGTVVRTRTINYTDTSQTWTDQFDVRNLVSQGTYPVGAFNIWAWRSGGGSGKVGATLLGVYGRGS